jgi:hypothetical protein
MRLQQNPDVPPRNLALGDTLEIGMHVLLELEQAGMSDTSSRNFRVTKRLIDNVTALLNAERSVVKLYLINLKSVDVRARGPLIRTAIRIAALKDSFHKGLCPPVSPASSVPNHWAGAYIAEIRPFFDNERKKRKVEITFIVATGPATGLAVSTIFSAGFVFVMRDAIGAVISGIKRGADNTENINLFANLNFCKVAIFIQMRNDLVAYKVSATTSMKTYNRKLVRSRLRCLVACPFKAEFDCIECSATILECNKSIHLG